MSAGATTEQAIGFQVWGADGVIYGPVELPTLVSWVKDERVEADTWVYNEEKDTWRKAKDMVELQLFFNASETVFHPTKPTATNLPTTELSLHSLRRVRVFAGMSDEQLRRFVHFMEVRSARQFTEIVRQGDPGDSMYLVLDGEVRVRLMIGGKETLLATLGTGEFFGEIALFDHGPRSADIVANRDSVLLKIGAANFQRLANEAPDLATPFLLAIGRTLTGRIRADNKRFRESVAMNRATTRP